MAVNPEHAQRKKSVQMFKQSQCHRVKADVTNGSLKFPGTGNSKTNEGSGDSDMVTEARTGWRGDGVQLLKGISRGHDMGDIIRNIKKKSAGIKR